MAARTFMRGLFQLQGLKRDFSTSKALLQGGRSYQPNNLERKFLVWTGKYKTVAEVPPEVSMEVMERCRNKMRIRVANWMIFGTVIGCIGMVISGKRAAGRGESVSRENLEWHKKYNQDNADVKN